MKEDIVEIAGLRTIRVGSPDSASMVIVMLHGFMMQPSDLSPFAASIGLPACWFFPEGPLLARPSGRAWWETDPDARAQSLAAGARDFADLHPADLSRARELMALFLDQAADIAGARPLVVGGFSQGGMLICDLLLRAPRRVAGVILLSSSRLGSDEWPAQSDRLSGVPVLISHGKADPDLAFRAGEALRDRIVDQGALVTWVPFDGGHEIPLPVWRRTRQFLADRVVRGT